ncbi:MerR family transcriptional regulator [Loigolactobacillus binensis]|uniref:MerR family transcriptional regulator n=1 Tax=Loigolactobacillus binensis TaxID=2559922 RepID=A0ABW3EE59_9LACO|nr:MerR family transcriptional regulator [Loigolactobacillus binensis]
MHAIREVATQFNLTYDALRYYEKIGLLPTIHRDRQGRREYSDDDLAVLNKLVHLRHLGASVAETRQILALFQTKQITTATYDAGLAILAHLDQELDRRSAELKTQKAFLAEKTARIQAEHKQALMQDLKPVAVDGKAIGK